MCNLIKFSLQLYEVWPIIAHHILHMGKLREKMLSEFSRFPQKVMLRDGTQKPKADSKNSTFNNFQMMDIYYYAIAMWIVPLRYSEVYLNKQ